MVLLVASWHKSFRPCRYATLSSSSTSLVLAGSGLAGLELLEVPVADLHVAAVLIEALCEALGGTGAVVVLVLLLGSGLGLDGSSGLGGAAAEEATDGVADRRANGDTAVSEKQGQLIRCLFWRMDKRLRL